MKPIIPTDFSLPFVRRERVAKDAYSFYFDRTKYPEFTFYPGQYNRIILLHKDADNRGSSRNFSIASSPNNKKELMITTRIVQSTYKKALFSMKIGTEVQFFGPVGRFIFDESERSPRAFFSKGVGMAPFHAILLYALEKKIRIPITLVASFPAYEDILYFDELSRISKSHPTIKILYVVTDPESSWKGEVGEIDEVMIAKYIPNIADCITMTCGPTAMVDKTIAMLAKLGVANANLRRENFVGY